MRLQPVGGSQSSRIPDHACGQPGARERRAVSTKDSGLTQH